MMFRSIYIKEFIHNIDKLFDSVNRKTLHQTFKTLDMLLQNMLSKKVKVQASQKIMEYY